MAIRLHKKMLASLATLALGTALPVHAVAGSYGAGIDNSQWYLAESVFECSLVHEVPGYGRAVFRHRAGEKLFFFLESETHLMRPGRGSLVVEAPSWRPGVAVRPVGVVKVTDGRRPVSLGARRAVILVQSLLEGMQPTVTRDSWYDGKPVRVQVSNINFNGQYQRYRSCAANLLPANFDQVGRSSVAFATGSKKLSKADMNHLDNIVAYIMADSTVERVFVDGHTDVVGSRIDNRALSEERANVVADYLKSRGVAKDLITQRSHGDRYPASRRRAENRRTTIRLQREGDRPELQQANGYGSASAG
ncbi:MAG: flagellar protein MotY [Marinobacter sp.]|uniref:flagellar protein MotY n=1 Tax=Marinobacter sp. TaxID=50741 RepID=UPI003F983D9C